MKAIAKNISLNLLDTVKKNETEKLEENKFDDNWSLECHHLIGLITKFKSSEVF